MDDKELSKVFATKLSLPKFISMMKRLTTNQRNLVCSIGFEHLLHLCCDQLPRGFIIFLVSHFDVDSRSLKLPNGASFILTPACINKVLGTPVGGRQIGQKPDPELRSLVAQLTKCKGQYPTISELDSLITAELDGDNFKLIYTMFAMTAFLCPSSHDGLSPTYLHIFRKAEEIILFDFSSAILDKLVSSIQSFKERSKCVLGGNLLSLLAIYFEFIDSDIIPAPSKSVLPRLSIWTTSLVSKIEIMDCVCKVNLQYGRLPIKDVSDTPFGFMHKQGNPMAGKSYEEFLNFILSICPENHHAEVKLKLPAIMANMRNEIMQSIEPILLENILKVVTMIPDKKSIDGSKNPTSFRSRELLPNEHTTSQHPTCGHLNSKDSAYVVNSSATLLASENAHLILVSDDSKTFNKQDGSSSIPTTNVKDKAVVDSGSVFAAMGNDALGMQEEESLVNHALLLPVPSDEVLNRLNEEAYNNFPHNEIESLIDSVKLIQVSSGIDLPYNMGLVESMYPKKIDTACHIDCIPHTPDVISYVLQQGLAERNLSILLDSRDSLADHKVDLLDGFDARSSVTINNQARTDHSGLNPHKRSSNTSTNDIAAQCVALKKRAKMFQLNEDPFDTSGNAFAAGTSVLACSHQAIESSDFTNDNPMMTADNMIQTPERSPVINIALNEEDCPYMNEEEWDKELLRSTLKIEAEYFAKRNNTQFSTQENETFNVSEVSPNKLICSFTSSQVEKEVFIDITSRIPKTTKAKSINVVRMGSTWVEHRVFGLSMQVYGNINKYVMNMLGKAVMVEDAEKFTLGLLPKGYWTRYFFEFDIAALFQKPYENPGKLSNHLSNGMIGFMLDTMDLVHLPLFTDGFYFLLLVNLRQNIFEVLYPNTKFHLICHHANVAIKNFKMAFKIAYKHSPINIENMELVFRSVCSSQRDSDSGVFVMELIRNQKQGNIMCFEPNHAKPLRESLTYYMLAHPFNEKIPAETKKIMEKHNIPHDFKTEGFYPWMHEERETSSQDHIDPIEAMLLF